MCTADLGKLKGQSASSISFAALQVLPAPSLPAGSWPKNLVIGYVGGYTYEVSLFNNQEDMLVHMKHDDIQQALPVSSFAVHANAHKAELTFLCRIYGL